jgi:hypothetical protein
MVLPWNQPEDTPSEMARQSGGEIKIFSFLKFLFKLNDFRSVKVSA